MLEMTIDTFLELCEKYKNLGWAVQEQLHAIAEGEPVEDQNFNAVEMIREFLIDADDAGVDDADLLIDEIDEAFADVDR